MFLEEPGDTFLVALHGDRVIFVFVFFFTEFCGVVGVAKNGNENVQKNDRYKEEENNTEL